MISASLLILAQIWAYLAVRSLALLFLLDGCDGLRLLTLLSVLDRWQMETVVAAANAKALDLDLPQVFLNRLRILPLTDLICGDNRWPYLKYFLRQLQVLLLNPAGLFLLREAVE